MRSEYIWVIAGLTGALTGAAATYYVAVDSRPAVPLAVASHNATSPVSESPPNPIAPAAIQWMHTPGTALRAPEPQPKGTAPAGQTKAAALDPAEEEAMVQAVLSRMYVPSMTLPEIMNSEEMHKLSPEARERVVAQMVDRINRGEIDARTFMAGGR